MSLDWCKFNPAHQGFVYTLSTISINRNTKFELYTQLKTKIELEKIADELRVKKNISKN